MYRWWFQGNENHIRLATRGGPQPLAEGSETEFITEHYWGCSVQRRGAPLEYRVEHPRWRVWEAQTAELHCDAAGLYGRQFGHVLHEQPSSAFLAEGSEVTVYRGVRLQP